MQDKEIINEMIYRLNKRMEGLQGSLESNMRILLLEALSLQREELEKILNKIETPYPMDVFPQRHIPAELPILPKDKDAVFGTFGRRVFENTIITIKNELKEASGKDLAQGSPQEPEDDIFITITKDVLGRYEDQIDAIQKTTSKVVKPVVIGCMQTAMWDLKESIIESTNKKWQEKIEEIIFSLDKEGFTCDGTQRCSDSSHMIPISNPKKKLESLLKEENSNV